MGNLRKYEVQILNEIFEEIEFEFMEKYNYLNDSDKLNFSIADNDFEKRKYLDIEYAKNKEKLRKCPIQVAGYIHSLNIQMPTLKEDFDERFKGVIFNFLITEYIESFEDLLKLTDKPESYLKYFFDYYLYSEYSDRLNMIIEYSVLLKRHENLESLKNFSLSNGNEIIFDNIAIKYKEKFGHDLPFGAFIFDEIKKKYDAVENTTARLNEYKKEHHFWVHVSLTDENLIGETEIVKRIIPLIENEIRFLEANESKGLEIQQIVTKFDKLKMELGKYGFFELPKIKQLSQQNQLALIELISTKGLPYSIAMFDFLGFLNHLEKDHFQTKYRLQREVSKWFDSDKGGRAVKGNMSTLSQYSKEDKTKYTAHSHKETVKTDYQKLK